MPNEPPRRNLIRAAVAEVRAIGDELREVAYEAAAQDRLIRIRRRAMACWFEVLIPAEHAEWMPAAVAALDEVERIESWMSVYVAESELSRVNRDAGDGAVAVSAELAEFLDECRRWHWRTGGAFDVASGALIDAWGFRLRSPRRPENDEIAAALGRSGFQHVRVDRAARTVTFAIAGVGVNPGAIGKGWAIDRAAAVMRGYAGAHGGPRIDNFLIQAGGSSAYAAGAGLDGRGWKVAIPRNAFLYADDAKFPPYCETARELSLKERALAASGGQEQAFDHDGERYSHIIDPRTGMASTRDSLVCVAARTAAAAEACSTALFVMNEAETAVFLRGLRGEGADGAQSRRLTPE